MNLSPKIENKTNKETTGTHSVATSQVQRKTSPIVRKPKRPLSSYSLFFRDQRKKIAELRRSDPSKHSIPSASIVSQCWKKISPSKRAYYDQLAAEDKFRHYVENMEYKAHLEKNKHEGFCRLQETKGSPSNKHLIPDPLPLDSVPDALEECDAVFLLRVLSAS